MDEDKKERETPHGVIYRPQKWPMLAISFIVAFVSGPSFGYLLSLLFGMNSDFGIIVCSGGFVLVFIFGYGLWASRLKALAFEGIGKGLMKFFWNLIIRRKIPKDLSDVLPDEDQLTRMAVRAQKAASSFAVVAIPVAIISSLLAAIVTADLNPFIRMAVLFCACLTYGVALSLLGRRGYLPFPEE